jgi:hypothetical protein
VTAVQLSDSTFTPAEADHQPTVKNARSQHDAVARA